MCRGWAVFEPRLQKQAILWTVSCVCPLSRPRPPPPPTHTHTHTVQTTSVFFTVRSGSADRTRVYCSHTESVCGHFWFSYWRGGGNWTVTEFHQKDFQAILENFGSVTRTELWRGGGGLNCAKNESCSILKWPENHPDEFLRWLSYPPHTHTHTHAHTHTLVRVTEPNFLKWPKKILVKFCLGNWTGHPNWTVVRARGRPRAFQAIAFLFMGYQVVGINTLLWPFVIWTNTTTFSAPCARLCIYEDVPQKWSNGHADLLTHSWPSKLKWSRQKSNMTIWSFLETSSYEGDTRRHPCLVPEGTKLNLRVTKDENPLGIIWGSCYPNTRRGTSSIFVSTTKSAGTSPHPILPHPNPHTTSNLSRKSIRKLARNRPQKLSGAPEIARLWYVISCFNKTCVNFLSCSTWFLFSGTGGCADGILGDTWNVMSWWEGNWNCYMNTRRQRRYIWYERHGIQHPRSRWAISLANVFSVFCRVACSVILRVCELDSSKALAKKQWGWKGCHWLWFSRVCAL